jgi:hypothetical protein
MAGRVLGCCWYPPGEAGTAGASGLWRVLAQPGSRPNRGRALAGSRGFGLASSSPVSGEGGSAGASGSAAAGRRLRLRGWASG